MLSRYACELVMYVFRMPGASARDFIQTRKLRLTSAPWMFLRCLLLVFAASPPSSFSMSPSKQPIGSPSSGGWHGPGRFRQYEKGRVVLFPFGPAIDGTTAWVVVSPAFPLPLPNPREVAVGSTLVDASAANHLSTFLGCRPSDS